MQTSKRSINGIDIELRQALSGIACRFFNGAYLFINRMQPICQV